MKKIIFSNNFTIIIFHIVLIMVFIFLQAGRASANDMLGKDDDTLYYWAGKYYSQGRIEKAAMYYFALQQKGSKKYFENQTIIDQRVAYLWGELYKIENFRNYSNICASSGGKGDNASYQESYSFDNWPPKYHVLVCTDYDYRGTCKLLKVGGYSTSGAIGLADNSISSILLGSGVKITLYQDSGYRGVSGTFTWSPSYLRDYGWDDVASSVYIQYK